MSRNENAGIQRSEKKKKKFQTHLVQELISEDVLLIADVASELLPEKGERVGDSILVAVPVLVRLGRLERKVVGGPVLAEAVL
jgi:hypothetical protein